VSRLPLLAGGGSNAVVARGHGGIVTANEFLRDVAHLAAGLPERAHVLNLCADRYRFAVGLAAALARGQISLLPPNEAPDLLARLAARYPGLYCLVDATGDRAGMETILVSAPDRTPAAAAAVPSFPAAQTAVIVFTSGSTGEPVPHAKSWGALVGSAQAEFERLRVPRGSTVLATVPAQHVYGLESTLMMPLQGGCALHAERPFYPADIRSALEMLPRPRGLVTTPVHLRVLLAEPDPVPPADFIVCATAPLSPQLAAQAEARFATRLHEIYGCTEAGQVASRRPLETEEWRALRGLTLRTDGDGTHVQGGHVEREILLGDVIELRGRERFLLHGRTADLVNIAGKRASIAHLNYHLNSIEGVRDGAFVMPDADEDVARLMAFVVAPGVTRETIVAALRQRIDPAFMPRPLCFVDELPRNATGKLPRKELDRLVRKAG
jgi:acyl-coenzyme A synthetase/AMP-(fatty) acid ligase